MVGLLHRDPAGLRRLDLVTYGADRGVEYYTGYLVEKSLSVDNLFVFLLLLTAFAVPAALQQRVLLIGIVGALVLRGDLHRARGARPLDLHVGVPALRGGAARDRREGAARRLSHDDNATRSARCARSAHPSLHAGHRHYRGTRLTVREAGRRAAHSAGARHRGDLRHRHRLRGRLGAGRLRHHRATRTSCSRPTPSPCSACARCTSSSRVPWVSCAHLGLRSRRDPRVHRRQARAALGTRRVGVGPGDPDPGVARRHRRRPGPGHDDQRPGQPSGLRGSQWTRPSSRRSSVTARH